MARVNVDLGERSYAIEIGRGLLKAPDQFCPFIKDKAIIVTNETVAPLYLDSIVSTLNHAGVTVIPVILPDGEQYKNWETLNQIFEALLCAHAERKTPLIALGGGVIGDMTGFAAACYQRGAPFIQVPTTLLSQVDSSVGGKTAINHPLGKNMIGAFHQPRQVVIDVDVLSTLPDREFSAGMAEVIKYGLIRDPVFFEWLEANIDGVVARRHDLIEYAIERSCCNKAEVVIADETEQGERATLNLGHTFGHAIETGMGYGEWLHGEAVAAGIMMAAELSASLGWLNEADVTRIRGLLEKAGLPTFGPANLTSETYFELMGHDKKVQNGQIRFVLLESIGRATVTTVNNLGVVKAAILRASAK